MATPAQYARTSLRACQEGNKTFCLKEAHVAVGIARLPTGRGGAREVLCGSQASWLGDSRALRFWDIVSSTALRDIRRKSGRWIRKSSEVERKNMYPRAVRLKQKAGVSLGAGVVVGAAMMGTRTGEGEEG